MTAKRFTLNRVGRERIIDGIVDNETDELLDNQMDFCERLNALNEENQAFKEDELYITLTERGNKLIEENQKLKTHIKQLKVKMERERKATTKQHLKWDKEAQEKINALHEENQQIKSTIKEAYENERTQIGKNVLKQLIEQIEE